MPREVALEFDDTANGKVGRTLEKYIPPSTSRLCKLMLELVLDKHSPLKRIELMDIAFLSRVVNCKSSVLSSYLSRRLPKHNHMIGILERIHSVHYITHASHADPP